MREETKKIARQLLTKRYPIRGFDRENARKVLEAVREAADKLEEKFPKKFVGLCIYGSRASGLAVKESDVDLALISQGITRPKKRVIFSADESDYKKVVQIVSKSMEKRGLDFHFVPLLFDWSFFRKKPNKLDYGQLMSVTSLFGLVTGKKINKFRLKVINHLERTLNPEERETYWSSIRYQYSRYYGGSEHYERLRKAGLSKELLLERQNRFTLLPLEEMKAILEERLKPRAKAKKVRVMPRPKRSKMMAKPRRTK